MSQPGVGQWTRDEHRRYLKAIQLYPQGPWKSVADYIGTRTARQTQTHAQKHREKLSRRRRGLLRKRATSDEWIDEYSSSPTPSSNPETYRREPTIVPPLVVSAHQMPQVSYHQLNTDSSYPPNLADDVKYTLPNPPTYVYQEQLRHDPYPYVTTYTNDARTIASYHPIDQYSYTTTTTASQHSNEPSRNPQPALDEMLLEYFGDDIRRHSTTSLQ